MKTLKLISRLTATFLLLLAIGCRETKAESLNNWLPQVAGSYKSQIESGNGILSGTTEFKLTGTSTVTGSYEMNEQGTSVPGQLSQCHAIQLRQLHCVWNDKYGTGDLIVSFSADFSKFGGLWFPAGSPDEKYGWSGSR